MSETKIVNIDHLRMMRENEEDMAKIKEMANAYSCSPSEIIMSILKASAEAKKKEN